MKQAQDRNYKILIEGANALMLDIDYGMKIWSRWLLSRASKTDAPFLYRHIPLCYQQQHGSWRYLHWSCHQPDQD